MENQINLIESFSKRGEKYLSENLQNGEKILAKLNGAFGQGFVLTDQHIYVVKWGYMTGNTFGGRCSAFNYKNIVGVEIKKGLATGVIEVLSSATRNEELSYWKSNPKNSALKNNYAVTFRTGGFKQFQQATLIARDLINKAHIL